MEFDYGTVARHSAYANQDAPEDQPAGEEQREKPGVHMTSLATISPRARDLFSDGSCAWTQYYTDGAMLERVGDLYSQDFALFGWYDLHAWQKRLKECLK